MAKRNKKKVRVKAFTVGDSKSLACIFVGIRELGYNQCVCDKYT